MNYGEVKTQFKTMLNRRDITPSMVDQFAKQSIQRAQRLLRVPASEATALIPVEQGFDGLDIPGDFLKLVQIAADGVELVRVDPNTVRRYANTGLPRFFAREASQFIIGPVPRVGAEIRLIYSKDFTSLGADTDTNWLTEVAPDIIVYGALSAACDHYNDPRKPGFEDTFVKAIVDLNNQAMEDELTNAQVMPALSLDFDW